MVWRLTHDIPEDDFNVEKGGQVEIIGWLYQYYNTEPKAQVFARPSGRKIQKEAHKTPHGRQTVKQLMKQGEATNSLPRGGPQGV